MHPRLAHEIINRVTLEFFRKYLQESARAPLLSAEESYPDTRVIRKVGT